MSTTPDAAGAADDRRRLIEELLMEGHATLSEIAEQILSVAGEQGTLDLARIGARHEVEEALRAHSQIKPDDG